MFKRATGSETRILILRNKSEVYKIGNIKGIPPLSVTEIGLCRECES